MLTVTAFRSGDQVFITSRTAAGVQDVVVDMETEVNPAHATWRHYNVVICCLDNVVICCLVLPYLFT